MDDSSSQRWNFTRWHELRSEDLIRRHDRVVRKTLNVAVVIVAVHEEATLATVVCPEQEIDADDILQIQYSAATSVLQVETSILQLLEPSTV